MNEDSSIWNSIALNEEGSLFKILINPNPEDQMHILQKIDKTSCINKRITKRYEKHWDVIITGHFHQAKVKTLNVSPSGILIDRLLGKPFYLSQTVNIQIFAIDSLSQIHKLSFKARFIPGLQGLSCRLMFLEDYKNSWSQLEALLKSFELKSVG